MLRALLCREGRYGSQRWMKGKAESFYLKRKLIKLLQGYRATSKEERELQGRRAYYEPYEVTRYNQHPPLRTEPLE